MSQLRAAVVGSYSRRKSALLPLVIVASVLSSSGLVTVQAYRGAQAATAQYEYDAAYTDFLAAHSVASNKVRVGKSVIADAQLVLDDSAGRVLSDEPRIALSDAIEVANDLVSDAAAELTQAERLVGSALPQDTSYFEPGAGARDGAAELTALRFVAAGLLTGLSDDFAAPILDVMNAVAAWQAEQDRILLGRYTNHVQAVGWTPELDACIGSVDVSAYYLDIPTIAEHWSCGGISFPDDPGTIITLTGVHSGTYRVDGIVAMLSESRNSSADIPRGYDLLYQTCQNGTSSSISFTALTRIDQPLSGVTASLATRSDAGYRDPRWPTAV